VDFRGVASRRFLVTDNDRVSGGRKDNPQKKAWGKVKVDPFPSGQGNRNRPSYLNLMHREVAKK